MSWLRKKMSSLILNPYFLLLEFLDLMGKFFKNFPACNMSNVKKDYSKLEKEKKFIFIYHFDKP